MISRREVELSLHAVMRGLLKRESIRGRNMNPTLAFILGPMEMIIVGGIFLLLFGNRLPSVMRSLGQSVTSFKSGLNEDDEFKSEDGQIEKKK
jgi:sec-independent protein translocase protein TatA